LSKKLRMASEEAAGYGLDSLSLEMQREEEEEVADNVARRVMDDDSDDDSLDIPMMD
jgi:hypothetical protein